MKTLLSLLLKAATATIPKAQWELLTPIKTRSEFPGIRMVYGMVGYAFDLQTDAAEA
jgi:hypothetical protein